MSAGINYPADKLPFERRLLLGIMPAPTDLERLYDAHAPALFAFLLNLTRNEADTRDLMQDLFIKLSCQPGILDSVRDERAFLFRLVHNAAISGLRRQRTREKYQAELGEESASMFAPAASPDEQAVRASLNEGLIALPPEQRAVVHLKLWEGLTFEAIAAMLHIPLHTAASRYRYGLDKLRQHLRPLYGEFK